MIPDELKKSLSTILCQATGIHDFVPYKSGTMICSGCGILAKVGAVYMNSGNPDDLIIDEKEGET